MDVSQRHPFCCHCLWLLALPAESVPAAASPRVRDEASEPAAALSPRSIRYYRRALVIGGTLAVYI